MGIEQISVTFGIAAGVTQLIGYWVYGKGANGKINTGSWSIWALGGIIDLVSFFAITGDWVVNILPAVCALGSIGTFCYAIKRRRFSWPDKVDCMFVGVDGMITVVWFFTNAVLANLLYQVSTILSFVPMWRGLIAEREKEEPLPWLIWMFAYSLLTVSVSLRLKRWEELAYPLRYGVLCFIVVLIVTIKQQKSR